MLGSTSKPVTPRLLFIVSRMDLARYASLKLEFDGATGEVILDRRLGERRWRLKRVAAERRGIDRRRQDVTEDLETSGWALVGR
jgi:hypothetical protein